MSKLKELLAAKRKLQIAELEGEQVDSSKVDKQLASVRLPTAPRASVPKARLRISPHARQRMSQRGVTADDVHTIWRYGETHASHDDTAFVVTETSWREAPASRRGRLRSLLGCSIIVTPPEEGYNTHVVRTVVNDGRDTTTARNK